MENTGVLIEIRAGDYRAGTLHYKDVCSDWTPYLPDNELQKRYNLETMACVSFSALNVVETQVNYLISKNPELKSKLNDYLVEGKAQFSDRFTAKMSGTTKHGNYLTRVWDSIRKDGLVPESMWNWHDDFDWDKYYAEIPQEIKDYGKKVLDILNIKYEWVCEGQTDIEAMQKAVKQAPVQIASATCSGWSSGSLVQDCGCKTNHATMLYRFTPNYAILDHYNPFKKYLALDYCVPYAMKAIVKPKMEYIITNNGDQVLLYHEYQMALSIGNAKVLKKLQDKGLKGNPIPDEIPKGYLVFPLVDVDTFIETFNLPCG